MDSLEWAWDVRPPQARRKMLSRTCAWVEMVCIGSGSSNQPYVTAGLCMFSVGAAYNLTKQLEAFCCETVTKIQITFAARETQRNAIG